MKTLIIAEKPELGRAIAAAIDGDGKEVKGVIRKQNVVITWAYGHLLRLQEPDEVDKKYKSWRKEDLPICFKDWKLVPDGNKKERVEQIGELIKECDKIIHAGDPDDEGQFLIDEILQYHHTSKPVQRVYINDNTPANVKKAFHELVDNDEKLQAVGRSAYARAVADYVVGINYSRLYSIMLRRQAMSVGRVQSPTLGLIVMRDEQIDNHVKQNYYELFADALILDPQHSFTMKFQPKNDLMEDGKHVLHRDILEEIQMECEGTNTFKLKVEHKEQRVKPLLPFNLAKLQAHMNTKYSFDLSKTDKITQTLRDRYQAITYNRSDSQYLKVEHHQEAKKLLPFVMNKLKKEYPLNYQLKSECFNDKYVTAHHAIIPTMSNFNIDALTKDERLVYEEICSFYIMQFLPPVKKKQIIASIKRKQGEFRAVSTIILDEGYKQYFKLPHEEKDKDEDGQDFNLEPGTYEASLSHYEIKEKQTAPPKRYTQASLIRDMTSIAKYVKDKRIKEILMQKDKDKKGENGSIGTSATRSTIVETLIKRNYVVMKGKQIISTQLGKEFYHLLPDEIKTADLTAKWWLIQEDIKLGKASVDTLTDSVLEAFRPHLNEQIQMIQAPDDSPSRPDTREVLGVCPVCGGSVVENSKGFGCVNYRSGCKFAIWKNDRYLSSLKKVPSAAMVRKLLKDKYCRLKLMDKENQEYIAILKMDIKGYYPAWSLLKEGS